MKESGIDNYQIVDFMEQYETNTDIADVILGEAVREPNHHIFPPKYHTYGGKTRYFM